MHAVCARRRGLDVLHIEREADPRGASVRNFGLIWVSGRAPGPELSLALRARAGWEELAAEVPGTGFRPNGSLTVASDEAELRLLKGAGAVPARGRGRREPRLVLPAVREHLLAGAGTPAGYRWLAGREAVEIAPHAVRDHTGEWHRGDLVVIATGANHTGVAGPHLAGHQRPPGRRGPPPVSE